VASCVTLWFSSKSFVRSLLVRSSISVLILEARSAFSACNWAVLVSLCFRASLSSAIWDCNNRDLSSTWREESLRRKEKGGNVEKERLICREQQVDSHLHRGESLGEQFTLLQDGIVFLLVLSGRGLGLHGITKLVLKVCNSVFIL